MTKRLSESAKEALVKASGQPGEKVRASAATLGELDRAGMIGAHDGLTLKGADERRSLLNALIDGAF